MRGHITSRGPLGKPDKDGKQHHEGPPYTFVVELGEVPAQRCPVCTANGSHKIHWLDSRPLAQCPTCEGPLDTIKERKQETKGHSGYQTKKAAEEALHAQLTERRRGTYAEPCKLTVREFLVDKWLSSSKHSVEASTYASYEGHVYKYIVPEFGTMLLRDLKTSDVRVFYGRLTQAPGGRGSRCLSPKTCHNIGITLHAALESAVPDYVTRNAATGAKKVKADRVEMKTWTSEALRTFLDSVADDPWAALWRLYAATGMRRGEALGLQWRDVDFKHATVLVERSLKSVSYKIVVGSTKTDRPRTISLDPWTLQALKKLHTQAVKQLLALGSRLSPKSYVFTGDPGEPIHPDKVTARFAVLQEKLRAQIVKEHADAGAKGDPPVLPTIRLHDLRHTWATLALEAGVPMVVVSKQLGHANAAITADVYTHVKPHVLEDASERVAALFSA